MKIQIQLFMKMKKNRWKKDKYIKMQYKKNN